MTQTISINSNEPVRIQKENVGAVLLDIKALKSDLTVADIADLNKISLDISVYRRGKLVGSFCNDYLDYILKALTAGSVRYGIAINPTSDGYLIPIPFHGCISVQGDDYIEIKCKVSNTAFTSLSASLSSVTIETVPAETKDSLVSVVDAITYTTNEFMVNKNLGDHLSKIVLVHDLAKNYDESAKCKPKDGLSLTAIGYDSNPSENLLILENRLRRQYAPDLDFHDLVIYDNILKPLNNAKLVAKYDKGVSSDARIMVLRRKRFN